MKATQSSLARSISLVTDERSETLPHHLSSPIITYHRHSSSLAFNSFSLDGILLEPGIMVNSDTPLTKASLWRSHTTMAVWNTSCAARFRTERVLNRGISSSLSNSFFQLAYLHLFQKVFVNDWTSHQIRISFTSSVSHQIHINFTSASHNHFRIIGFTSSVSHHRLRINFASTSHQLRIIFISTSHQLRIIGFTSSLPQIMSDDSKSPAEV
jgi:hypothetical protein